MVDLLLISNSFSYGQNYLEHCIPELLDALGEDRTVLFVPFALHDRSSYSEFVSRELKKYGIVVRSVHLSNRMDQEILNSKAILVGGGNTFRLLKSLYELDLIDSIRQSIQNGNLYIGSSAGSNVACPSIKTTNDMPIVFPPSFEALGFISFQINPHYIDPDPDTTLMMETREKRLVEFHEENDLPIVAMREGAFIRVTGDSIHLGGKSGAVLFEKDTKPKELESDSELSKLLESRF